MPQGRGGGPKPRPHLRLIKGTARGKGKPTRPRPQPESGVPSPPPVLSAEARAEWDRVAPELYRLGYLTPLDRAVLAAYAQSFGRWLIAERQLGRILLSKTGSGTNMQHPLLGIARRAGQDAVKYATELGMSPVARLRFDGVQSPPPSDDPADKYF